MIRTQIISNVDYFNKWFNYKINYIGLIIWSVFKELNLEHFQKNTRIKVKMVYYQCTPIYFASCLSAARTRCVLREAAKCTLSPALLRLIVSKMSLCMYVYTCVECACVQPFAPRAVLFLTPHLRTDRLIWSNFTWYSTHRPTQKHLPHQTNMSIWRG
jgi:hypothetical protein